jgi:hypothetical protein
MKRPVRKRKRPGRSNAALDKAREDRRRALHALSLMRKERLSLTRAAKEALTIPRKVKKYVKSALRKKVSGRYEAKPSDRLARSLRFLAPDGQIGITVHSSRTASKIAEYWAAVDHYLRTGDTERLAKFRGKSVQVGKNKFVFVTDPRTLNRIAAVGEVSFEQIYMSTT